MKLINLRAPNELNQVKVIMLRRIILESSTQENRWLMSIINPISGVTLPTNIEARFDMDLKRQAISRFMFNMAFENSIEDGYVTEKPFDALISGNLNSQFHD